MSMVKKPSYLAVLATGSVIQVVDEIIAHAVRHAASDIHFEISPTELRIRYRIDGVLYDQLGLPSQIAHQVIARIKVLAHIDIAQHRVPHDGKFGMVINNQHIDFRVSMFPSVNGEKVVIRILDCAHSILEFKKLGFTQEIRDIFQKLLQKSHGFFLVSGPTGSGKTTTLYAALSELNSSEKNIITLEDPVEYSIGGITQGQIHPPSGFTFEKGIRSMLRQDPDIVLIGEIRDKQTAQIAIEASLTGHLVLSTIHTNDAPSVIMRLMDMGIEPFLINAAITGILAQRLVRTICSGCRIEYTPTEDEKLVLARIGLPATIILSKGKGCSSCLDTGYKGRTVIGELLVITPQLRGLIIKQPDFDAISTQARADGMKTLLQSAAQKVQDGEICLEELLRVIV